tara:strand:- start:20 stop:256 length:237 start_codon:yes stop_codon:yes gene_type:complete
MKKLLSIFLISIILMGCEKEEENCNCGVITNDEILDDCYSLTIKSDCSNNNKTFCFSYDIWFNNSVGDDFCVTNEDGW